ncbi:MAG: ribonuclease D [Hyphomicrobiaceae bacterium]|nr:ribonuclease D [Hyphomicrobiaceae bacterium]
MNIITRTDALATFCAEARKSQFVTVDTEFHRETTYWPLLCLIQVAHDTGAAIIDPMVNGLELDPFFELLADPGTLKVFHAARQDIEIFVKLTGKVPVSIFDTQMAASVCGHGDSVAYDKLVGAITGEKIDKSSRFTDWRRRPLSDQQLTYALADVTHLREVYLALEDMLRKNGRHHWLETDTAQLNELSTYLVAPEDAWKRLKVRLNRPVELAALQELAAWREAKAQNDDVPRGRILKDDALVELAMQRPVTDQQFDRLRAVPKGFGRSPAGREVVAILTEVNKRGKADLPKLDRHKPGPSPKGAIGDLLRVLLKAVADDHGVAPRIIASADDLNQLVLEDDADIPALKGWRREIFGEKAIALKEGRLALAATPKGVREIEIKPSGR